MKESNIRPGVILPTGAHPCPLWSLSFAFPHGLSSHLKSCKPQAMGFLSCITLRPVCWLLAVAVLWAK